MRLTGYLSEAHTSRETQTLEARGVSDTPPSVLLCGNALRMSEGTRLLERAQQLTRAVRVHPTRLSLSTSGATPQAAQPPRMGKKRLEGV